MPVFNDRAYTRLRGARNRRSQVSPLGLGLILLGVVVLAVTYTRLPSWVYGLWPLALVAIGVFGLISRPAWVRDLDVAVPGFGGAVTRRTRAISVALIVAGLLILLFTLHLVDERVIGPGILIVLGVLLIWRRRR
jgi:hypothetical protein